MSERKRTEIGLSISTSEKITSANLAPVLRCRHSALKAIILKLSDKTEILMTYSKQRRAASTFLPTYAKFAAVAFAFLVASAMMPATAEAATLTENAADSYKILGSGSSYNPDQCMSSFYGELVNGCADTQVVRWALPMAVPSKTTNKTVTIVTAEAPYFSTPFSCFVLTRQAGSTTNLLTLNFTAASQSQSGKVVWSPHTWTELYCVLPPGDGIASITWQQ